MTLRLAQLGPPAAAFCGALAILGDDADPNHVAVLAGLASADAWQTARQLADIEILRRNPPSPRTALSTGTISFVHPLVRAAVYEGLAETVRLPGHARAARLLADRGHAPERAAAHLLIIPPAGDGFVVDTLRRAADQAFARGSPDRLIEQAHFLTAYGCFVLIAADLDEVAPLLDSWIAVAHRRGSVFALAPAKCFRGLSWLVRGALTEAEQDLRDALWAITTTSQRVGLPVVAAHLADVLMEQGKLAEAEAVIDKAIKPEPRFAAHGGQNPAVVAWRSGAALALHRLGRCSEARKLAAEEVALARRWGAPTALGRALRIAGVVHGDPTGLALLREATTVLAGVTSPPGIHQSPH